MRAEQICLSQGGQYGKEWLSATHFVAKIFERMRQGVANGKTQGSQPKGVQKNGHLVTHADRAILQVSIIKAQPGIDEDSLNATAGGDFDLSGKLILHQPNRIPAEVELANFSHVPALHVTNYDGRLMIDHQSKHLAA